MGFREVQAMVDSEARVRVAGMEDEGVAVVVGQGTRVRDDGMAIAVPRVRFDDGGSMLVWPWLVIVEGA